MTDEIIRDQINLKISFNRSKIFMNREFSLPSVLTFPPDLQQLQYAR